MSVAEAIRRARPLRFVCAAAPAMAGRTAHAPSGVVQGAAPGPTIELTFNKSTTGTATAAANGSATLGVPSTSPESNVQVHVDSCGSVARVVIVEVGRQAAAAAAGCSRSTMWGSYIMRPVTTFVVDLLGTSATLHIS